MTVPAEGQHPAAPDDQPAALDDRPAGRDDHTAQPPLRPTQMLQAEQQWGYLLAAALAGFGLASQLPSAVQGDGKAAALAAVGVGLAAILAAAVRYGQRVITSFTAVIGGFAPLSKSYVGVSFVCLLYGAWLMWRTSRAQQKAKAAGVRIAPRPRRRHGRETNETGASDRSTGPGSAGRPAANRRYTPPKAKRPAGRRR
jgi:hypothetical protein